MKRILLLAAACALSASAIAAETRKASCISQCFVPDSSYPREARRAGIQGRIELTFIIGRDGRVASCEITAAADPKLADPAICAFVQRRWRYKAALNEGEPVDETRIQQVGFYR